MSYTTEDAMAVWKQTQRIAEAHGPDTAFTFATEVDPELLALTLVLSTLS